MIDYKTSENSLRASTARLNTELKSISNEPVLLLLSGGSALALLDSIDISVLNSNITLSPLDERYSHDSSINNFAQIATTEFYEQAKGAGCKFIDTRVQNNESQEELANRFESRLKQWLEEHPNGKVIGTIGIGPDGHTSGMMPFPEDPEKFHELFEGDRLAISYDAGTKNEFPARVTTTMILMRKIYTAIVYAVGENKKEALSSLKEANGSLAATPARILREMKNVILFTDQQI